MKKIDSLKFCSISELIDLLSNKTKILDNNNNVVLIQEVVSDNRGYTTYKVVPYNVKEE